MPYPIEFLCQTSCHLELPQRQRDPHAQLLHLYAGSALLRLGKQQWLLPKGASFWLPAECLYGLTRLAGAQIGRVRCSVRISQGLPTEAGFLTGAPLLPALLDSLSQDTDLDWQGAHGRKLLVLRDTLQTCSLRQQAPLAALDPGLAAVVEAIMAGGDASAQATAWTHTTGLSPRSLPARFRTALDLGPSQWQSQWQLLQTLDGIKRGLSEAQAATAAGLSGLAAYQRLVQRYLPKHAHAGNRSSAS
ncbi:hypothetical protein GCM10023095_19420 [Pseudaeromonas paramecii]|uniref:AraC family transcriptional regulator n=2 Tax=Pseudaeromonas paramecii TaxID=2138166 RepID=A0ABP8QAE0_9GAMM